MMTEYAVINTCYGGFGLSQKAKILMGENFNEYKIIRNDKKLVEVVRKLGIEASGKHAQLVAIKLKPATTYVIYEFDGMEVLAEDHKIFDISTKKWVLSSKKNEFVIATIKDGG